MSHTPKIYRPEFFVGQQLVCVNYTEWITEDETEIDVGPAFMEIVTIKSISADGIFLEEYTSLHNEPYHFDCFIPISTINSRTVMTEKNLSKK